MTRVLVTGAGNDTALAFVDSIRSQGVTLYMADADAEARGMSRVPVERRVGLPRLGGSVLAEMTLQACVDHRIDVLVPTCDEELLALSRRRHRFRAAGTTLMLAATACLEATLDRASLHRITDGVVHRPRTEVFGADVDLAQWSFPVIVKPRFRADPRPARILYSQEDARRLRRDHALLIQEYFPGPRVEVDVLTNPLGTVIAAAQRELWGQSTPTLGSGEAIDSARRVVRAIGGAYACTVCFRRDRDGRLGLLDVVPRVSAGMSTDAPAGMNLASCGLELAIGEALPANTNLHRPAEGWAA